MKQVYKVVGNWHPRLRTARSAVINRGPYNLTYEIGKKTCKVRNTTGIMVFETEEAAIRFANTFSLCIGLGGAIFLCETDSKIRKPELLKVVDYDRIINAKGWFKKEWLRKIHYQSIVGKTVMPPGTKVVDSLVPIKVVRKVGG